MQHTPPGAIVCLTAYPPAPLRFQMDAAAIGREIALDNDGLFGSQRQPP